MHRIGLTLSLTILVLTFSLAHTANADEWGKEEDSSNYSGVFIPENEFTAFFDSQGIYTVVGAIKNFEVYPIVPTVTISIKEGNQIISEKYEFVTIFPTKELPFKIKFPEVSSTNPILEKPEVSYRPFYNTPINIEILYDDTLVLHEDGHTSGRIINNGDFPVTNIKIFALIYGEKGKLLDMGQNIKMIEKLEPGEIREFSIYPDPSIASEVKYYSCFAPTDSTIVPVTTTRNDEKFFFRYDSGSWYYDAKFNEENTELSMNTYFSFQLETYANFEFPYFNDKEKFEVYLNGEPKDSIQSIDEMGNWHVAFNVKPKETGKLVIKGFDPDWYPVESGIPNWITTNAKLWSEEKLYQYDFVRGINFMISEGIIEVPVSDFKGSLVATIPDWLRSNAAWWADGTISDQDFTNAIQFLIEEDIIQL